MSRPSFTICWDESESCFMLVAVEGQRLIPVIPLAETVSLSLPEVLKLAEAIWRGEDLHNSAG